jgi:hypothetical protein
MANEFKHLSVGGEITQSEFEAVGGHILDSQAIGDIIYATSTSQLSRLGIGSTGAVLTVTGGVPAWDTTWTPTGHLIPASDDSYDLGSAVAAWQDLFLEGDISLTDAGSISTAAGALTIGSAAAINITPTAGSAILLDGTISIDAGVVTGATSITSTAFAGALTGNVTGNASGTAATVTGGTQASITVVANVVEVGALDAGSITSGFTSIDVGAGAITTTGALSIASMGTNWTNAGRTVADMGIVTTIDINGGTINGITDLAVADGGTGASTLNNLITMGTHTTGNYVATVTAGTGLTSDGATSGESVTHSLSVDASQGQITTVGALASGTIADGFGTINNGSNTITTTGLVSAGSLTVTGTTTLNGNLILGDAAADTLAISATIQGATPLVFEGANAGGDNAHETSFAITDPTADRTITFPDATLTVNAAANISGTTLASNVVTSSLTAVGTIATGVWGATDVGVAHGGTGASTAAAGFDALAPMTAEGDIIYGGSSGTGTRLAKGSDADVLTLASGVPTWATPTTGDLTSIVAGTGLTGSSLTSGDATLNVIGGTGITANANDIAVDASQTQITAIGTIGTGVWQGTPVATAYIADNSITLAKLAGGTDGNIISFDASGDPVAIATGNDGQVLTSTGAGSPPAFENAAAGYSDAEAIAAVEGEATLVLAGDVEIADSKFIEFASAAGTPTTDNKVQGIVIEFLAVEAITQFDAVYVSTTTGRVGRADANVASMAKMPVIGIAIEAQGSAGSSVRVLTHGVYRDDGGFGGNMTVGVPLYAPEAPGTLTTTAPSDDGDFVQKVGVSVGVRSVFINPSLDVIEHA